MRSFKDILAIIAAVAVASVIGIFLFTGDGDTPPERPVVTESDKPVVEDNSIYYRNPTASTLAKQTELPEVNTDSYKLSATDVALEKYSKMEWDEFISKINSTNIEERVEAFYVLRYSKTTIELEKVRQYLGEGVRSENEEEREAALEAAGEYTDNPAIMPVYESVMFSENSDDKNTVIQYLFNMEWGPDVERLVARGLFDKDEDVRETALSVLNNQLEETYDEVADAVKHYGELGIGAGIGE